MVIDVTLICESVIVVTQLSNLSVKFEVICISSQKIFEIFGISLQYLAWYTTVYFPVSKIKAFEIFLYKYRYVLIG